MFQKIKRKKYGCNYERKVDVSSMSDSEDEDEPILNNKNLKKIIKKVIKKVIVDDEDNNIPIAKNKTKKNQKFDELDPEFKDVEKIKKILTNTNIIEIKKLLTIIQADNKDYNTWIKVGITLFSISSDENMFKIWSDWSFVNYASNIVELNNKWNNFSKTIEQNDWGLFNLRKYTKSRYPNEYKKYFEEHIFERTKHMLFKGTQPDASKLFYQLKPNNYIFQNGIWYYLNSKNIWKVMSAHSYHILGNDLLYTISNELSDLNDYVKANNIIINKSLKDDKTNNDKIEKPLLKDNEANNLLNNDKIEKALLKDNEANNLLNNDKIEKPLLKDNVDNNLLDNSNLKDELLKNNILIATIKKFEHKISCKSFLNDCMYFLSNLYTREQIYFDRNKTILPFENCLYDLKTHAFRNFKPDDYVTTTTGYDWFEPKDEDVVLVKDLFSKIQLDIDYRNCLLDILCTGLYGLVNQCFIFYLGNGANGKSTVDDTMLAAMGNFGAVINAGILCKPLKVGGANSDFANMNLKRYLLGREPPENEKYCKSIIKEVTGSSKINARALYSPNDQTEINATFGCESNHKPLFDGNITYAEVRRILLINFTTRFTMNDADVNNINVFKANDEYIQESFHERIKTAFLKVLFEHNKLNFKGQITIPIKVRKDTDDLLLKANDFLVWFDGEFEFIENPSVKDFTTLRGICDVLGKSAYYNAMTARQQNTLSEKALKEMFINHPLYSKYFSSGIDTTFERVRIKCGNCLKGCVKKIHDYL